MENFRTKKSNNRERTMRSKLTLIVFDWDNTLFPTKILERAERSKDFLKQMGKHIGSLEIHNIRLLQCCMSLGTVIIVSNSRTKWFESSCSEFMPKLWDFININNIVFVSAHDKSCDRSDDPFEWKRNAFEEIVVWHKKRTKKLKLVSIGDGEYEKEAARDMIEFLGLLPASSVKIIQLIQWKHIGEFIHQKLILQLKVNELVNCGQFLEITL